jgi:hypothetical protein
LIYNLFILTNTKEIRRSEPANDDETGLPCAGVVEAGGSSSRAGLYFGPDGTKLPTPRGGGKPCAGVMDDENY